MVMLSEVHEQAKRAPAAPRTVAYQFDLLMLEYGEDDILNAATNRMAQSWEEGKEYSKLDQEIITQWRPNASAGFVMAAREMDPSRWLD